MNNEYQSGLYGTYLKYFQNKGDFNDFITDDTKVKEIPNVALIESVNEELDPDNVVLTELSNPAVWSILSASGLTGDKTALTVADCAAFTNDDLYNRSFAYIKSGNEYYICKQGDNLVEQSSGDSIFTYYNTYGSKDFYTDATMKDSDKWTFNEFKYFTGITEIGYGFFQNCFGLTEISIPSSVTSIDSNAFTNCIYLRLCTIYNSVGNVDIFITDDQASIDAADDAGVDHIYALDSAFPFAGIETDSGNTIIQYIQQDTNDYVVAYNWSTTNAKSVITEESNPDVYNILTTCNYPHTGPNEGYTAADLAAITSITAYNNTDEAQFSSQDNKCSIFSFYGNEKNNYDSKTYIDFTSNAYEYNGPNTPNYVQSWAFNEFKYFTGLTELPDYCFNNCTTLTEITLPSTITSVGKRAFHDCWSLEKLNTQGRINEINWNNKALLYMSKNTVGSKYWDEQDDTAIEQLQYLEGHGVEIS